MGHAPDDPTRPADESVAAAGELADEPEKITRVTVSDGDDVYGLLLRWGSGEWFYAETGSYCDLDERL